MDVKKLTSKDIDKYQSEIKTYRYSQKIMLGIAWGLMGSSFIVFIGAIIYGINYPEYIWPLSFVVSLLVCGGITCFILRGALYNNRIKNRLLLIRQYKEYQATHRSLEE